MKKDFLPYELAVKLKAIGFDEPCMYAWCITPKHLGEREGDLFLRTDGNPFGDFFTGKNWNVSYNNNKNKIKCSAPTFSQAFRWFREKHELFSSCDISNFADKTYGYVITSPNPPHYLHNVHNLKSMEEAELACLEKLIEIVETKSK